MPSTDEELVARSMGGDLDSFNQLVLRWERPIYALAYRVIGREEDARDVAQETFLRAFRALKGALGLLGSCSDAPPGPSIRPTGLLTWELQTRSPLDPIDARPRGRYCAPAARRGFAGYGPVRARSVRCVGCGSSSSWQQRW